MGLADIDNTSPNKRRRTAQRVEAQTTRTTTQRAYRQPEQPQTTSTTTRARSQSSSSQSSIEMSWLDRFFDSLPAPLQFITYIIMRPQHNAKDLSNFIF